MIARGWNPESTDISYSHFLNLEVLGDVGDWPIGSEIAITTQEYSNMTSNVS